MHEARFEIELPRPPNADRATAERERRALGRVLDLVQHLLTHVPATELAEALSMVDRALAHSPVRQPGADVEEHGAALARELAGGHEHSFDERRTLEVEGQLRAFRVRQQFLADSLTAPQVADLLGTSRQTPHDRVRSGSLLAVLDRGQLRFPRWQFDPSGPDGVVPGLPALIRALDVSPLAKVSWLTRPTPILEDRTPLNALKAGDGDRALDASRAVGMA